MRTAFTEDEEDLERGPGRRPNGRTDHHETYAEDDREVTLSSATLLMIFFGLVLVCGLFFGLGYTLGRRSHSESADAVSTPPQTAQPLLASTQPKPSPSSETVAPPPAPSDAVPGEAATPAAADDGSPSVAVPENKPAANVPQSAPQNASKAAPATAAPAARTAAALPGASASPQTPPSVAPPGATPSGIMVQIAAISNPADADVLVGALRKHGYSVTIRNQPGDSLLHVQVGPFSTRADAVAMKQKLLSDGYNAILK